MGILLEIANRTSYITQKRLAVEGGSLLEILEDELKKEREYLMKLKESGEDD